MQTHYGFESMDIEAIDAIGWCSNQNLYKVYVVMTPRHERGLMDRMGFNPMGSFLLPPA